MSAGTITLTNGSAIVGGSGTSFATELAAGDFIVSTVGGVPYTLPVKSVESNTQLTLVSNFTGPTQSGAAWSAVPRVALNMVTAALVAQSAEALRGLNYDKQNWQQVYSAAGNITVKLPDGTTFTGPSWKYLSDNMATKSGGAVPVNQGGTGATDAAGARTNLGLGNSATRDVGTAAGTVAAGNDNRFNTIEGKSGGTLSSDLQLRLPSPATTPANGADTASGIFDAGWSSGVYQQVRVLFHASVLQGSGSRAVIAIQTSTGGPFTRYLFDQSGNATAPGSWVPTSDARLKTDIKRIDEPLMKMGRLRGCTWMRLDTGLPGIGFLAQEVADVFPDVVTRGQNVTLADGSVIEGVLSPDTYGVAAALHHEAILALMEKIDELTLKVEVLQSGR